MNGSPDTLSPSPDLDDEAFELSATSVSPTSATSASEPETASTLPTKASTVSPNNDPRIMDDKETVGADYDSEEEIDKLGNSDDLDTGDDDFNADSDLEGIDEEASDEDRQAGGMRDMMRSNMRGGVILDRDDGGIDNGDFYGIYTSDGDGDYKTEDLVKGLNIFDSEKEDRRAAKKTQLSKWAQSRTRKASNPRSKSNNRSYSTKISKTKTSNANSYFSDDNNTDSIREAMDAVDRRKKNSRKIQGTTTRNGNTGATVFDSEEQRIIGLVSNKDTNKGSNRVSRGGNGSNGSNGSDDYAVKRIPSKNAKYH